MKEIDIFSSHPGLMKFSRPHKCLVALGYHLLAALILYSKAMLFYLFLLTSKD